MLGDLIRAQLTGREVPHVMLLLSPYLTRWMGAGELTVPLPMTILTGLFVGVYFLDGIVAKAVLAALGQVRLIAKATLSAPVWACRWWCSGGFSSARLVR